MRHAITLAFFCLSFICSIPSAAPADDLAAPDTKLTKLNFKFDDRDYVIDASEGSAVEVTPSAVHVTHAKGVSFTIEPGRRRYNFARGLANVDLEYTKRLVLKKKGVFLLEASKGANKFYSAATVVELPYIDFTVTNGTTGAQDASAQTQADCLLVLKCAKTLSLQTPPPSEPVAVLEWLKADVRKDDDGKVQSIALPASTTDAALPLLGKFPGLKSLTITLGRSNFEGITDESLAELDGMASLEELGLIGDHITEEVLIHVGKLPNLVTLALGPASGVGEIAQPALIRLHRLANLQTLDLTNTRAGDEALACVKELRNLRVLRLGSTLAVDKREGAQRAKLSTLSDEGLANLADLSKLETLSLRRTDITGVGFKHLVDLKRLGNLELNDTFITNEGLEQIAKIESLHLLQLARTNITGQGLKPLASLDALKELDLTDTAIDDKGIGHIAVLVGLESLQLRRTLVTDAGLLQLDTLKNLEALNLSETKITDAGLPHLYRLKKLQSLYTSDTAVTQDALDKLDKARESQ